MSGHVEGGINFDFQSFFVLIFLCSFYPGRHVPVPYFLSRRGTSGLTPAQDTTLEKLHNGGNTRRNRAQDELNRHVA